MALRGILSEILLEMTSQVKMAGEKSMIEKKRERKRVLCMQYMQRESTRKPEAKYLGANFCDRTRLERLLSAPVLTSGISQHLFPFY